MLIDGIPLRTHHSKLIGHQPHNHHCNYTLYCSPSHTKHRASVCHLHKENFPCCLCDEKLTKECCKYLIISMAIVICKKTQYCNRADVLSCQLMNCRHGIDWEDIISLLASHYGGSWLVDESKFKVTEKNRKKNHLNMRELPLNFVMCNLISDKLTSVKMVRCEICSEICILKS